VTPSKTGYTFSPTSTSATITSANSPGSPSRPRGDDDVQHLGSAGTSSATVTAGSSSATSDTSNNYTIASLAAGTYTVYPVEAGCTFSPASQSVTISSANVTGITSRLPALSGDLQLTSGRRGDGQSVAPAPGSTTTSSVPSGATNLTSLRRAPTGDVDIYTQSGAKADLVLLRLPAVHLLGQRVRARLPTRPPGLWWPASTAMRRGATPSPARTPSADDVHGLRQRRHRERDDQRQVRRPPRADASSNFTLSGLANGTYTVTPTKSGCTFTPATKSVTVSSANVTGVTFTASCGTGTTLFTDGFEGPAGRPRRSPAPRAPGR